MSTVVYYISEDGFSYSEGPVSEKPSSGVIEVPKKPSLFHDWDFDKGQWAINASRQFNDFAFRRNQLLRNTYWLTGADSPLSALEKTALSTFRLSLLSYSESDVTAGNPEPAIPASILNWI